MPKISQLTQTYILFVGAILLDANSFISKPVKEHDEWSMEVLYMVKFPHGIIDFRMHSP